MKRIMKAMAAIMLMTAVVCFVSCTKLDDVGHEYVDLGLPSGTLWATCNLGASTPESYGDYYAWGETQTKDSYSFDTYKWSHGGYNQLTKYCNDPNFGYNGFTDDLTILLPEDDAATVNWGASWRIPAYNDWVELAHHTTQTWITRNGVKGMLFTALNGNSLFLPASGKYVRDELCNAGLGGYYWSNLLGVTYPDIVWFLYSSSGDFCLYDGSSRCCGHTIRPVRSAY